MSLPSCLLWLSHGRKQLWAALPLPGLCWLHDFDKENPVRAQISLPTPLHIFKGQDSRFTPV